MKSTVPKVLFLSLHIHSFLFSPEIVDEYRSRFMDESVAMRQLISPPVSRRISKRHSRKSALKRYSKTQSEIAKIFSGLWSEKINEAKSSTRLSPKAPRITDHPKMVMGPLPDLKTTPFAHKCVPKALLLNECFYPIR